MKKTFLAALLITAGGLALAPLARATPVLGVQLAEATFATSTSTSSTSPLIVSQGFGTFSTNVEVNTLGLNPLSIDLGSTNVSTSTGGTLVITASVKGLTSPTGALNFLSQFSGHLISGSATSVTLQTYFDNTDTLFGTQHLLDTLTMPPFGFVSGNSDGTVTAPFALTEVFTIVVPTDGKASLSLDGSTTVPEPGSLLLLGTALIGIGALGFARRRRA